MQLKTLCGVAVVMVGTVTAAHASTYKLALDISRHGTPVGKPSIEVQAGRNADVINSPPDGKQEDAVRLQVAVAPTTEPDVVAIHMKVFDKARGYWTLRAEPNVKAKLDKNVSLNIRNSDATSTAEPIEVRLTVAEVATTSAPR